MGLAAILPRSSARILVYGQLASWGGAGVNGSGGVECSRHRVTPLGSMSVSISIVAVGVSVPVRVMSVVGLGSVGASSRAVWMSGLSIVILRTDFAMLQEGTEKKETV